jgi:hypothetical protein
MFIWVNKLEVSDLHCTRNSTINFETYGPELRRMAIIAMAGVNMPFPICATPVPDQVTPYRYARPLYHARRCPRTMPLPPSFRDLSCPRPPCSLIQGCMLLCQVSEISPSTLIHPHLILPLFYLSSSISLFLLFERYLAPTLPHRSALLLPTLAPPPVPSARPQIQRAIPARINIILSDPLAGVTTVADTLGSSPA